MYQNNNGARAPKKPKINEWQGEGVVRPRSGNDTDEIRVFEFQNGGAAINISLMCQEYAGADQNGQPKMSTTYVPVKVMANKNITLEQLRSVRSGMKVRIVGRLKSESYTSKRTGQQVTTLVVNAFVFEILEMPQQAYAPQQPQYQQFPQQPQYPGYGQQMPPQYGGQQAPYGQLPQQPQYPGYGQPAPPQYGGQRPPQYGQQPQYNNPPAQAQPQQPQGGVPPYYQAPGQAPAFPPQNGAQPAPQAPPHFGPGPSDDGDLPI